MKRKKRAVSADEDVFGKTFQELRHLTANLETITQRIQAHERELSDKDVEIKQLNDQREKARSQVLNSLPDRGTTRLVCRHCPIFIDVFINKWDGSDPRFPYKWEFEMGWRCGGCS